MESLSFSKRDFFYLINSLKIFLSDIPLLLQVSARKAQIKSTRCLSGAQKTAVGLSSLPLHCNDPRAADSLVHADQQEYSTQREGMEGME